MSKMVDSGTMAVWGDAMCAALVGDRRALVELLRCGNPVTRDVAEFVAWLLEERKNGRPRLPAKFKVLDHMARKPALFDASMDYKMRSTNSRAAGKRLNSKDTLTKLSDRYGVSAESLNNMIRRSPKNGR
jgi:hypothetical protein